MPLSGHGHAGCCPVFTGCRYSLIQDRIQCQQAAVSGAFLYWFLSSNIFFLISVGSNFVGHKKPYE